MHDAGNLAFFKYPNDVALSADSIKNIPRTRSPQPRQMDEVACDHMSYFTTEVGLQALAQAVATTLAAT